MAKRSKLEVSLDFLQAILDHPNWAITRTASFVGFCWTERHVIVKPLFGLAFIQYSNDKKYGRTLVVTSKGRDWLKRAKQLMSEISIGVDSIV